MLRISKSRLDIYSKILRCSTLVGPDLSRYCALIGGGHGDKDTAQGIYYPSLCFYGIRMASMQGKNL